MLEVVEFTLLSTNKALLPASDVPKSQMYRKMINFENRVQMKNHFRLPNFHLLMQFVRRKLRFFTEVRYRYITSSFKNLLYTGTRYCILIGRNIPTIQ